MDAEKRLAEQDVVVRRGRIAAISPAGTRPAPRRARVVDGRGRFLIPGLADVHVHLRHGPDAADNPPMLELFAVNGVTTVLNLMGLPEHLALRDRVARGRLFGPVIYTSGPFVGFPGEAPPRDPDSLVVAQKKVGYDFVKVHDALSPDAYHALMEACRRNGLRVIGHATRSVGLDAILRERQYALAHAEEFLSAYWIPRLPAPLDAIPEIANTLALAAARAGVWVIPTLTTFRGMAVQMAAYDSILALPFVRYVPSGIRRDWHPDRSPYARFGPRDLAGTAGHYRLLAVTVRALRDAGVRMLAGTDTPVLAAVPPGFSLHDELERLVDAGLTPYEALRTATIHAAEFLGDPEEFGAVREGMRADLILLDDDPLLDIWNTRRISGVMMRGLWMPRERLDRALARLAGEDADRSGK